jgi:hypothetical protein
MKASIMSNWHGGKGSGRRSSQDDKKYADNYDLIFKKNTIKIDSAEVKGRKVTPDHGKIQVHKDESRYDRTTYKQDMLKQSDLNWDGNDD